MTALYLDGFDHYGAGSQGSTNMLAGSWAATDSSFPHGPGVPNYGTRTGILSLSGGSPGVPFRLVIPGGASAVTFMSLGFSVGSIPSVNNACEIVSFCTSANVPFARLVCQADGSIALTNNTLSSNFGVTSGPVIVASNWHFLEMMMNPSTGAFTLRVDDPDANLTPVMTITGASFGSSTTGQLTFMQNFTGSPITPWIDDLFVRDSIGSINNTWLGDRRIATLLPNANTTTQGWNPSYYKEFGSGILRLAYAIPGTTTPQNQNSYVNTNSASALNIGANDFTLETEIRFDQLPSASSYSTIFSSWDTSSNNRAYRLILGGTSFNNGSIQFDTSTDGTSSTVQTPIVFPWSPLPNVWYQLALCRAAGELLLFVNGQQFGLPIADSRTYYSTGSQPWAVGIEDQAGGQVNGTGLVGRMDETRFTNGVSRYTGPYTPPTAAFPRGSISDPDWAQVVVLMGYDSGIIDESGFNRSMTGNNGALAFQPSDGPAIGQYSTIDKATPDDNTFIAASLTNATNVFTMTTQPTNGTTVTVGTKNGSVAAVYTWKTALASAFDVLIDTSAQNSLTNLLNAINAGAGGGTKYGTGTTSNFDVNATQLPAGQFQVNANTAGTAGNSVASTSTSTGSWAHTTLTGGLSIPGPSEFKFQRPPNNTTIVSAMQMTMRANKTDAGTATVQDSFIGALGGVVSGATHNLTISPIYYNDVIQTDPDTGGVLTPTTITNGTFEVNRTA